jgi:hypothetical protein
LAVRRRTRQGHSWHGDYLVWRESWQKINLR